MCLRVIVLEAWDLQACNQGALDVLTEAGCVQIRTSEFGEIEVAASLRAFFWRPMFVVSSLRLNRQLCRPPSM